MTSLWAFIGASLAIYCEYLYRTLPGSWVDYLWAWVPLQCAVGYCVYRLVTSPGVNLLDAFVIWTFSTIILRVLVSAVLLKDEIFPGTWAALALLVAARVVQVTWK